MSGEFNVTCGYDGYVFVGCAQGRFDVESTTGIEKKDYFNMYVISPVSSYESEDYKASGMKAEKKKCISAEVWKDLQPGDRVVLFFDDKKRVVMAALDQ